jgi:hypothetical protein
MKRSRSSALLDPHAAGLSEEAAKKEGYWRRSYDEESELPWPIPEPGWVGRAGFLASLDQVEAVAERIAYRGFSLCRLCGRMNGHEGLRLAEWEWPAGFRHYVADHEIRPSRAFEAFIRSWHP